eukprot:TRINITY_DN897_c0_g1_i1.p2 TRINITY_DN897_c0_g1~~TRINITY_DN897_c0_g1_i1.p2  ORF type:complete len:539 (-),score=113.51 TRINITY_DN897_c0_g1_i1:2629-4245(-)
MVVPFQPTGVSYFNSLFDRTISNVVFSGFLAFLVLLELENVTEVFMYRAHNINKRSLDQYILFSRVSSMRGMLQTLSGLEYPPHEVSTQPLRSSRGFLWRCFGVGKRAAEAQAHVKHEQARSQVTDAVDDRDATTVADTEHSLSDEESQLRELPDKLRRSGIPERDGVPRPRVKRYRLIAPVLIRFVVLLLELAAIYSSSNITDQVLAARSFNVRLTAINGTDAHVPNSRDSRCQEFIEHARGVEQSGIVLLCIDSEENRDLTTRREHTSVTFRFDGSQNRMEYLVADKLVMTTRVYARVLINLINDDDVELAPLRPDLEVGDHYSRRVIQGVMTRALNALGFNVSLSQIQERVDEGGVITYEYDRYFDEVGREQIGEALLSELQQFTLGLNVTQEGEEDVLYAFKAGRGYFRHHEAVIAVVGRNRVAQGWLLIAWVTLLVVRLIAQRFFTVFDELAYPAVKKVHGADLSLGPLACVRQQDTLYIGKFSDGRVGHIGYRAANERQDRVSNFHGCEIVLGSREQLLRHRRRQRAAARAT